MSASRESSAPSAGATTPLTATTPVRLDALYAAGRRNSIGFLRFLLASLVVVSHTFRLGGFGPEPLQRRSHETLGTFAVNCFFILSGFLIARSYVSIRSTTGYLWHRFLRIFPGYWVCLLVIIFGFGDLLYCAEHHSLAGYFSATHDPPLRYFTNNFYLSLNQAGLDSLLSNTPLSVHIDGPLWSLQYEFRCYLLIALLGIVGLLTRWPRLGRLLCVAILISLAVAVNAPRLLALAHLSLDMLALRTTMWFFAGTVFYLYAEHVPARLDLFIVAAVATTLALYYGKQALLGPVTLSYVLFYLALKLPLTFWDRHGDFSYGLYIYAFPVQQTLASFGVHRYGVFVYFISALSIATLLAMASWFLVERPALRLKHRWLGRAARQRRDPSTRDK